MPLNIVFDDITGMKVDAIVNSTNSELIPGGTGVDMGIHYKAGPQLATALNKIAFCETGEVVITDGYDLPSRYIIHTVGPVWRGGYGETSVLAGCYTKILRMAEANGCHSIALPIISAGANGFPKRLALMVATKAITDYLYDHEMDIFIVVYNREMIEISEHLGNSVHKFVEERYVSENTGILRRYAQTVLSENNRRKPARDLYCESEEESVREYVERIDRDEEHKIRASRSMAFPAMALPKIKQLPNFTKNVSKEAIKLDEGFGEAVIRLREEKGIKSADLCLKANITKAVLSNIIQSVPGGSKYGYKPKKTTAVAIGIAFRLNVNEMNELLKKAGYVLSRSDLSDVIVEYFIQEHKYDIYEINEVLFTYDQQLLGSA